MILAVGAENILAGQHVLLGSPEREALSGQNVLDSRYPPGMVNS